MPSEFLELKFDKGLNSAVDSFSCPQGHCLTFSDYQMDYGVLKPRTSFNTMNQTTFGTSHLIQDMTQWSASTPKTNGSIFVYENGGGTAKLWRSTTYEPSSDGTITFTDVTGSATLGAGVPGQFAVLGGVLFFATGNSGTGVAIAKTPDLATNFAAVGGSAPARVTLLRAVNNFLFASGGFLGASPTNWSTVNWSNAGDGTTWSTANSLDFRPQDGDYIIALGELGSNLLIFKTKSIGLLNTIAQSVSGIVTLGPMATLFKGIGAAGPNCVDNLPDGRCIFLGSDLNVYVTDGSTCISLTDQEPPGLNVRSRLNFGLGDVTKYSCLRYFPNRKEIWVSVSNSGVTTKILAYDLQKKYWREITGLTGSQSLLSVWNLWSSVSATPINTLLYGNDNGNIIDLVKADNATPTDQTGATVTPSLSTSVLLPPNFIDQGFMWLTIHYSSSAAVTYAYGFDGTYSANKTLSLTNKRADVKINLLGTSNNQRPSTFQLKFVDTGSASIYRCYLSAMGTA